jgi:hypothetical protein
MKRVIALTMAGLALLVVGCSKKEQQTTAPAAKPAQQAVVPPPKAAPAYFRDHYAKLDDCVYDWGYPQKCMPVPPGSPAAQSGASFFGPIYAKTYREETQVQLRKEALEGGYVQRVAQDASDKSIAREPPHNR